MSCWAVGKELSIHKGEAMRILLLLLGLIAVAPASAQPDIAADWGGATLHLPLPTDYCAVDKAQAWVNIVGVYAGDRSLDALLDLARREVWAVIAANGAALAADADPAPSGPAANADTPPAETGQDRGKQSGSFLSRLSPLQMGVIVVALGIVTLALVLLANQRSR